MIWSNFSFIWWTAVDFHAQQGVSLLTTKNTKVSKNDSDTRRHAFMLLVNMFAGMRLCRQEQLTDFLD